MPSLCQSLCVLFINITICVQAFGDILNLVPVSENVTKLTAVCTICFKPAAFTRRKTSEAKVMSFICCWKLLFFFSFFCCCFFVCFTLHKAAWEIYQAYECCVLEEAWNELMNSPSVHKFQVPWFSCSNLPEILNYLTCRNKVAPFAPVMVWVRTVF